MNRVVLSGQLAGRPRLSYTPCGVPLDRTTAAMVSCVEQVLAPGPPDPATLRKVCRGEP